MRNRDLSWRIISMEHLFHPLAALFLSTLLSFPGSLPLSTHFCSAHSLSHPVSALHRLPESPPRPGLSPVNRRTETGCRRLCGPAKYIPPCSLLALHVVCLFSYRDAIKTPLTVKYVCVFNLSETFCFFSWINKLTDKKKKSPLTRRDV